MEMFTQFCVGVGVKLKGFTVFKSKLHTNFSVNLFHVLPFWKRLRKLHNKSQKFKLSFKQE